MMNAAIGGVLVGIGGGILLAGLGRIAGVSGMVRALFFGDGQRWRVAFLAGVILAGTVAMLLGSMSNLTTDLSRGAVVVAGLVCGIGAKLGNGCTSGHGVCGLGRLSLRSMVAASLFCVAGIAASYVVRGALQ